jgi:hypothetical protein
VAEVDGRAAQQVRQGHRADGDRAQQGGKGQQGHG